MSLSILLPTKNRLDLLRQAVETVRRQDVADWELVIADNCSDEDVPGFVTSLGDPRIRLLRSETPLPVTENWNRALDASSGDYVLMLGDDDGLLQGALSAIQQLVQAYGTPELIYTGAFLFAYPGVLPDAPKGFLQDYRAAGFFAGRSEPFWLEHRDALRLVRASTRFRMPFTYNMQHSVIHRGLIEQMKPAGPFFQSPYPDFYATNAAFLVAERVLISPHRAVVVGISPKSFGSHFLSGNEGTGVAMLANDDPAARQELERVILPGTQDRTSWLIAMETLRKNFGFAVRPQGRLLAIPSAADRVCARGRSPACAPSPPKIVNSFWRSSTGPSATGTHPP